MEGEVFSQFHRPKTKVLEMNDGVSMTEQSGVIPMREQVERFVRAGELLRMFRETQYDATDEKGELALEEFQPIPMGADIVEVQRIIEAANARMVAAREVKRAEAAKAAAEKAAAEKEAERQKYRKEVLDEIAAKSAG